MPRINYHMIEIARDSRKMSQKALSELLPKLNQATLSKIEHGDMPISDEDITHIAKALDYPVEFFYQEDIKTPLANMYYRKRATLPTKELNKIIADVKIVLKSIDYLLEYIDLKEYPRYVFDYTNGWTPASSAVRLKEILELHNDKPVTNLITKIEDLGIVVFFYDSPHEKFDGLTAYTDKGVPVIFVNKNKPNDRLKFTIVHELLHLVMHLPCNVEPWRDYEGEANTGTQEFLMPAKFCSNDLKNLNYSKLGQLKSYWGVSKSFIIRLAKDLGMINESTYTYLNVELGRKGERVAEHGYVDLDSPQIIKTIISLLKEEADPKFTDEDIAKKLRLNMSDYYRLFAPQSNTPVKLRILKSI